MLQYISPGADLIGRQLPNAYLLVLVQTLDLFDRTSDRVPGMGQLRGHIDVEAHGYIRVGWMVDDPWRRSSRFVSEKEVIHGAWCSKR